MISLADATELLRLLGDPNRVRLMALLSHGELTVAELVRITRMTQSRVSTHLGKLREAGLVRDRPVGASSHYAVNTSGMSAEARSAWELVRATAADPLLDEDERRMREGQLKWADAVAGRMERHYSPGRTWQATLRGLLGLMRLDRVLDIASGDCALAELIAPRARSVTCIDNSETVLRAGRRRLRRLDHVRFGLGDMHALPFADDSFDHVLMLACLCYADDPPRAVAEAARVLRPGGDFVAVTLRNHRHVEHVARYDHVQNGFSVKRVRAMLAAAGLETVLCEVTSRERQRPHFEVITAHATKGGGR